MPAHTVDPRGHHAARRHRQRRAGVRLLLDHGPAGAALPVQPGLEPGDGADRGAPQRLRVVGEPECAARRLAAAAADCARPAPRHRARHADRRAGQPGTAALLHLRRPAAADSLAGRRLSPADPVGTVDRLRIRRRPRRALRRHDDLRSAAGGDAEQPGLRETRVSRGARVHPARGVELHRGGVCLRRPLHAEQHHADSRTSCRAS